MREAAAKVKKAARTVDAPFQFFEQTREVQQFALRGRVLSAIRARVRIDKHNREHTPRASSARAIKRFGVSKLANAAIPEKEQRLSKATRSV